MQAPLRASFKVPTREVRRPHFGDDENLVAVDPCGTQAIPHLPFVVVHFGGIDVPIADAQCPLYDSRTGGPAQIPSTQADERNPSSLGFDKFRAPWVLLVGGHCNLPSRFSCAAEPTLFKEFDQPKLEYFHQRKNLLRDRLQSHLSWIRWPSM